MLTHVFFDEGQKQRLTWFEDVPNARHGGGVGVESGKDWGEAIPCCSDHFLA